MSSYRDFTYDKINFKGLPQLIEETRKQDLKWTLILDPGIEADIKYESFTDGLKNDVFIHWPKNVSLVDRTQPDNIPDNDIYYGKVWPKGPAAFPDFFKKRTVDWWRRQVERLYKEMPFDALWIVRHVLKDVFNILLIIFQDMSEPSNFEERKFDICPKNKYDFPSIKMSKI